MMGPLTVVIPAFNEERTLPAVIRELRDLLQPLAIEVEILVVDDGSTDGTARVASESGARVIQHRSNRGYGAALKTGIAAATHDVTAIIDADGTYPAIHLAEIPAALE